MLNFLNRIYIEIDVTVRIVCFFEYKKNPQQNISALSFSIVTSFSPLVFLLLSSVSEESKTDLIFAEGVSDDLLKRNTGGSVFVLLIYETETDRSRARLNTAHDMTFVSTTKSSCPRSTLLGCL